MKASCTLGAFNLIRKFLDTDVREAYNFKQSARVLHVYLIG